MAYQNPDIYIPNAFIPAGINNSFKPYGIFYDKSDYQMSVFDRWGNLVFSSSDAEAAWDGTFHGSKSESGVYVYRIKFKSANGKYIDKKGIVTLLR